jgi:hypothetical protein
MKKKNTWVGRQFCVFGGPVQVQETEKKPLPQMYRMRPTSRSEADARLDLLTR